MTTNLEYHYQTIGRIIGYLVDLGLKRVDLDASDAMKIMTERWGDEEEVIQTFADVVRWMDDEGIIRIQNVQEFEGGFGFSGVQLTAKGLDIVNMKKSENEPTIRNLVEDQGHLDSGTYGRIGELVGGFVGGFTKSLASG